MGLAQTQRMLAEIAFHEERLSGCGGSDMGALYNLGFGCRRKMWYEKTKTKEDFPKVLTPELERGHYIEPVIRDLYEAKTGRDVRIVKEMLRHPIHEYMVNHPDGKIEETDNRPGAGIFEAKCVNRFIMKRFKKEGIRDEYVLQVQQGLYVSGLQWGSYAILCLDPWEFAWFDVTRDSAIIDRLIEDTGIFWALVQNGQIPEPLPDIHDKRCNVCQWRRSCRGADMAAGLSDSQGQEQEGLIKRDDLAPLVSEIEELKSMEKDAKDLKTEAEERLKTEIGEALCAIMPGFRAYYSKTYPKRLDQTAVKSLEALAAKILAQDRELWDLADRGLIHLPAGYVIDGQPGAARRRQGKAYDRLRPKRVWPAGEHHSGGCRQLRRLTQHPGGGVIDGRPNIDDAPAVGGAVGVGASAGGHHQGFPHLHRRPVRVGFQDQGAGSGHQRRGAGGAGGPAVGVGGCPACPPDQCALGADLGLGAAVVGRAPRTGEIDHPDTNRRCPPTGWNRRRPAPPSEPMPSCPSSPWRCRP